MRNSKNRLGKRSVVWGTRPVKGRTATVSPQAGASGGKQAQAARRALRRDAQRQPVRRLADA